MILYVTCLWPSRLFFFLSNKLQILTGVQLHWSSNRPVLHRSRKQVSHSGWGSTGTGEIKLYVLIWIDIKLMKIKNHFIVIISMIAGQYF